MVKIRPQGLMEKEKKLKTCNENQKEFMNGTILL